MVRSAVNAPVALHARHDEPVPQLKAANPERLEKRCDVVVGCPDRGLVKLGHAFSLRFPLLDRCAFNYLRRLTCRQAFLPQEWLARPVTVPQVPVFPAEAGCSRRGEKRREDCRETCQPVQPGMLSADAQLSGWFPVTDVFDRVTFRARPTLGRSSRTGQDHS